MDEMDHFRKFFPLPTSPNPEKQNQNSNKAKRTQIINCIIPDYYIAPAAKGKH
jgi:hypothetical protein